jgi:hypothetical protein
MIEIRMNEKAQHTAKIHLHDDLTMQWLRQGKLIKLTGAWSSLPLAALTCMICPANHTQAQVSLSSLRKKLNPL